jgi:hypothetical protein
MEHISHFSSSGGRVSQIGAIEDSRAPVQISRYRGVPSMHYPKSCGIVSLAPSKGVRGCSVLTIPQSCQYIPAYSANGSSG